MDRKEDVSRKQFDYAVRMRLAEWLSSAGVNENRIAVEVLYLLPPAFVSEYTNLFHAALNLGNDGHGEQDAEQIRVGKVAGHNTPGSGGRGGSRIDSGRNSEIGSLPGGAGTKGRRRGIFAVRDDARLAEKDRVDRSLRKLARGMATGVEVEGSRCGWRMNSEGKSVRGKGRGKKTGVKGGQEIGCGKYLENGWKYCPWCGYGNRK